jgi:hypothetical protein
MTKALSTDLSDANIAAALAMLESAPRRLEAWRANLEDGAELIRPAKGERTGVEIVAHMLNAEARSGESIALALLANEPEVPPIHPERDWGRLFRLDQFGVAELLAYHATRRKVLLSLLGSLAAAKWARAVREPGKARRETVYLLTRSLALHEALHVRELEQRFSSG